MKNIICVSAPSGAGKTTLCKAIRKKCSDLLWSVSYTTRQARSNEINGEDYHFISKSKFDLHASNNDFAEFENVHGEYYGTMKINLGKFDIKSNNYIIRLGCQWHNGNQKIIS